MESGLFILVSVSVLVRFWLYLFWRMHSFSNDISFHPTALPSQKNIPSAASLKYACKISAKTPQSLNMTVNWGFSCKSVSIWICFFIISLPWKSDYCRKSTNTRLLKKLTVSVGLCSKCFALNLTQEVHSHWHTWQTLTTGHARTQRKPHALQWLQTSR